MTHVLFGNRITRQAELRLGCTAVLFDENRSRVLLTRRKDNGTWCLPGGMIEAGESVAEGCTREVLEETGLNVRVLRLTGVYSDPNQVVVYPDDNHAYIIVLCFEVERVDGEPRLSNETIGIDWFPVAEAVEMELFHGHALHVRDACSGRESAYIR